MSDNAKRVGTPRAAGELGETEPPRTSNESISNDIAECDEKEILESVPGDDLGVTVDENISAATDGDKSKTAAKATPPDIFADANDANNANKGSDGSDDEVCVFDLLASKKSKRKKKPVKSIPISIALPSAANNVVEEYDKFKIQKPIPNVRALDYLKEKEEICYDFDFPDDDSEHYQPDDSQAGNHPEEAELLAEKEADLAKIRAYLKAKWEERTKDLNNEINELRAEMIAKQNRQRKQLADNHKRQLVDDSHRMDAGLRWLKEEQEKELETKVLQHQEDLKNGEISEEDMAEWNTFISQLQARHEEQIKQFEQKKQVLNKKAENELNAQSLILSTHHKKRQEEADRHIQDTLPKKCFERQEQLKAKLMKLHNERYEKLLLEIRSKLGLISTSNSHDLGYSEADASNDEKLLLDKAGSVLFDPSLCHHAVARHKRRKISTSNASFGMSVEIHNEGIIVMTKSSEADHIHVSSGANHRTINLFLPWGAKARKVLHSVMCGEIPSCSEISNIHYSGKQDLDGGMVRCMITDMRTSADTATCHRADSFVSHMMSINGEKFEHLSRRHSDIIEQIAKLTSEYNEAKQFEETVMNSEKEAIAAHKGSKDNLTMFRTQAQLFFKNDGSCPTTVSGENKNKLLATMKRYKDDFEATKGEILALQKKIGGARTAKLAKIAQINKLKKEEMNIDGELKKMLCRSSSLKSHTAGRAHHSRAFDDESVTGRVDNVITAIHHVAEKRRSIVNEKKTNGTMCTEWGAKVEGLDIDASSKKSIWQKMQRKRVNTVLRPPRQTLVKNLLKKTPSSSLDCFDIGTETETDPSLRAEELFLLSLHPESPIGSSLHAERELGWHIYLDAPLKQSASSILHLDTTSLQNQNLLSVCCSTGRQAASFLEPYHLRALDADYPLSFATQASSLAETNPSCQEKATQEMLDADPLTETDEQTQLGCSFIMSEVKVDKQQCIKNEPKKQKSTKPANATPMPKTKNEKNEKRRKKPKGDSRDSSKAKSSKNTKNPTKKAHKAQMEKQSDDRQYLPQQNKEVTVNNYGETGPMLHPASSLQVEPQHQQHSNFQQLYENHGNVQQHQFQNYFGQNQLMQVPTGMVLNQHQQGLLVPQQQQQQLQMLRNMHSMQQQQQQQLQQHSQQRVQNQIYNQNQQQISLNYLQAQQRISLSQQQMAQLYQQNTIGNNVVSMQHPQHQQQQQRQQQNFNNQKS